MSVTHTKKKHAVLLGGEVGVNGSYFGGKQIKGRKGRGVKSSPKPIPNAQKLLNRRYSKVEYHKTVSFILTVVGL